MSQQTVNIGSAANDGTGDPLRTAFDKINDNFNEIYDKLGGSGLSNITLSGSTITNTITNGDLTIDANGSGKVVIEGDLIVNGTNTQIETTQLTVEDNFLELNSNNSSGADIDAGIYINRGSSDAAYFYWDEGDDKWKAGTAGASDSSAVSLNATSTIVANIEGDSATITTVNTNTLNSSDSTAIQVTDGLNVSGTVSANTIDVDRIINGDSSAIEIDEALVVSGGVDIGGDLTVNTISSPDSTAIQVNDGVNISGTLSVDTIDTNSISSTDSSRITIADGISVGGSIQSTDSTSVTIDDNVNVEGTITSSGDFITGGSVSATDEVAGSYWAQTVETVTGAGGSNAMSVTTGVTLLNTSGGTASLSIADGGQGQVKYVVMAVAGNNATLDNTNGNWTTQILFDAVGEAVTLVFDDTTGKWSIVGVHGATVS